jgi:hypothetical protein
MRGLRQFGNNSCNGGQSCQNNGSGNGSNNCFPANATVTLADGQVKRMDQLATGDLVATRSVDGRVSYQPIYAW